MASTNPFTCLLVAVSLLLIICLDAVRSDAASNRYVIAVRLKEGSSLADLDDVAESESIYSVYKSVDLPDTVLDDLANTGIARTGQTIPNMKLWQTVELAADADPRAVLADFSSHSAVDVAEIHDTQRPPPSIRHNNFDNIPQRNLQTATPNYENNQAYLNAAPEGINAEWAWTQPGGTGASIKVYDIEYSWNRNHEDLQLSGVSVLATGTPEDPFRSPSHGTAVLGELVGKDNGNGVKGICFAANAGMAAERTKERPDSRAAAIMLAVNDGTAGDVILLEMQESACNLPACREPCDQPFGPAEWHQDVFEATLSATANGFVVVAAAGNGNVDLDQSACENRFNLNVRDSGAIIVGAGGASPTFYDVNPREKMPFSSYGSRVDVQGYGESVYTTGYGEIWKDPSNTGNLNRFYTNQFSGTSSASPIVAGAAVLMQSYSAQKYGGRKLTSKQIRNIFRTTGTPQHGSGGRIGNLPNLVEAFAAVDALMTATDAPTEAPTSVCFSGVATVEVLGKGSVPMEALAVGDSVFTGMKHNGRVYEPVYAFGHLQREQHDDFLRLYFSNSPGLLPLEISTNHLLRVVGHEHPVRADTVQVGDQLWSTQEDGAVPVKVKVTRILRQPRRGIYQPLTASGYLVVNGIHVSAYASTRDSSLALVDTITRWLPEHTFFHITLSPLRLLCLGISSKLCQHGPYSDAYEERGLIYWQAFELRVAKMHNRMPMVIRWALAMLIVVLLGICYCVEAVFGPAFGVLFLFAGTGLACATRRGREQGGARKTEARRAHCLCK